MRSVNVWDRNILQNPSRIDEDEIAELIERPNFVPRIQFLDSSALNLSVLKQLNHTCERFGSKIHVRFYGNSFDCRFLSHIPSVRYLALDFYSSIMNIEYLQSLPNLNRLGFGVYHEEYPRLLESPNLVHLERLYLSESKKNKIDLSALAGFQNLNLLSISGHGNGIEYLGNNVNVTCLLLNSIRKNVDVNFISQMAGLRHLSFLLGGRANIDNVNHHDLMRLEIVLVRGFERIDLNNFPNLQQLSIENQLQLTKVDLEPVRNSLERLTISNCKRLVSLSGLAQMNKLKHLWIGQTLLNSDALLSDIPKCVTEARIFEVGRKNDQRIKKQLERNGYAEATYPPPMRIES